MSTIKSQDEDLTLNAHGSGNDIKFQSNGVEKASISDAGLFTSTTIDATKLTGALPAISGAALTGVGVAGITSAADATAMTITSAERVGINKTAPDARLDISAASETALRAVATVSGEYAAIIQSASTNTTPILSLRKSGGTETVRFSSQGGILFNGDSAEANALNDYETGTWTPNLSVKPSGVALGTVTVANYTKIGDRVFISLQCAITSSSVPAPNNDMRIIGFPFTNANSGVNMPAIFNYNYKETPQLHMNGSGYLYFQSTTVGGNNQSPAGGGLDANTTLSLAIQYKTNS